MKKMKFMFFGISFFVLCFAILGITNLPQNKVPVSYAAPTANASTLFNYLSIINNEQVLNSNNVTVNDDNSYSIMVNGSTTIFLNPFSVRYSAITFDENQFIKNVIQIQVEKTRKMSFFYRNQEISCEKRVQSGSSQTEYYYFSSSNNNSITTLNTSLISYTEDEKIVTFEVIESFSLILDNDFNSSEIEIGVYNSASRTSSLKIHFLKPVIRFANAEKEFIKFESYKDYNVEINDYSYHDTSPLLQSEQTFNKVKLTFLNDNYRYTEINPLYFVINFNGFAYDFKFYSEEIDGEDCLIVKYTDEAANNTIQLATDYTIEVKEDEDTEEPIEYIKFNKKVLSNEQLSLTFSYRGRYAFEFYDNTYLQNVPHPNYYKTSFYLKNDSSSDEDTNSKFNDIYILAQATDDKSNPLEYIVNKATLNTSVLITIKNMSDFGQILTMDNVVDRIEVTITEFGNSIGNDPVKTIYYPLTEENKFDENIHHIEDYFTLNSEGDYTLSCSIDAIYRIEIFSKTPQTDNNNITYYDSTYFQVTIVKKIKATFKPDIDDASIDTTHTATVPYKTETLNYINRIQSSDPIQFEIKFDDYAYEDSNKTLDKTFNNQYNIMYGMQTVKINSYINEDNTAITFEFLGVGDMTVYITYNGEESTYQFNSEKRDNHITFSEYGNYSVTLVDSMGTTPTEIYVVNFKKDLNTSAIILIVLSSIIILAIAIFIISVRGKVKTR